MKKIWKFSFVVLLLAGLVTSAFAISETEMGKKAFFRDRDPSDITYEEFKERAESCGRIDPSEENFEKLQAMHEARMNEDWDTVMSIKEELGIEKGSCKGNCKGECNQAPRKPCGCGKK